MRINFSKKEILLKIVYFGPSLGGKTTSLRSIYSKLSPEVKGQFMSINTKEDRTLFFDFFDLKTTTRMGKVRFELYTVPGQVIYEETRRLVMKGADGIVFVADSQISKMSENLHSRKELDEILRQYGQDPDNFPIAIQYNKRDLKEISPIEEMNSSLNPKGNLEYATVAITGENIIKALNGITTEVLKVTSSKYGKMIQHKLP